MLLAVVALVVALPRLERGEDLETGGGGGSAQQQEGSGAAGDPAPGDAAQGGVEPAPDGGAGGSVAPPSGPSVDPAAPGAPGGARRVEREAELVLTTTDDDLQDVADRVVRTTDRVGGVLAASDLGLAEGVADEATLDLRVPVERLADALAARLAHVAERRQATRDVTGTDRRARERRDEARAERRGLLRALGRATDADELARLRARLARVRRTLDATGAQLARLRGRTDLARVAVTVRGGRAEAGADGAWTPGDAARDAGRVLEVAAGVLIVGAAVLAPLASSPCSARSSPVPCAAGAARRRSRGRDRGARRAAARRFGLARRRPRPVASRRMARTAAHQGGGPSASLRDADRELAPPVTPVRPGAARGGRA